MIKLPLFGPNKLSGILGILSPQKEVVGWVLGSWGPGARHVTYSEPDSLPLSLLGLQTRQEVFLQRRQQLLHHQVGHHLNIQLELLHVL